MTSLDPPRAGAARPRRAGLGEAPATDMASTPTLSARGPRTGEDPATKGMPGLVALYLGSLIFPVMVSAGGLALQPYRVLLLLLFIPLAIRLLSGRAGKVALYDWMIIAGVAWEGMALLIHHGLAQIEGAGINTVEYLGAWMLGRVGIRSAREFRAMARFLFLIVLALLPFAAIESFTGQPILLKLIPMSPRIVWYEPRFGLRRAQTVFAHPILFGVFVSATLGIVWHALEPTAGILSRAWKAVAVFAGTFFSLSTGAIVSYVVQAILIGWELISRPNPARWRIFGWGAAFLYVALDLLSDRTPFHLIVNYATLNSDTGYYRLLIFRYGMENVWANPIFGLGLNDWERPFFMGDSVDNFWLLIAMQYGIPAFVLIAGGLAVLIRRVIRAQFTDTSEWACRAGWLTSISGVVVAGGTVHYWHAMLTFVMFLFGAGAWMARPVPKAQAGGERRRSRTTPSAPIPTITASPTPAAPARASRPAPSGPVRPRRPTRPPGAG
jgi:hypothetical protein